LDWDLIEKDNEEGINFDNRAKAEIKDLVICSWRGKKLQIHPQFTKKLSLSLFVGEVV
jgi:hypothetical protein